MDAGPKRAARGWLKMQDAKNRQEFAVWAPSHNLSVNIFTTKAHIDNQKKRVKQQYFLQMSSQYGELRCTIG